jgi:hypothetical protein
MSVDITFGGEADRQYEALAHVDPRLVPLFVDLGTAFDETMSGQVLSLSAERLDELSQGLDTFAAVIQAERERRQRLTSMTTLFGEVVETNERLVIKEVTDLDEYRQTHQPAEREEAPAPPVSEPVVEVAIQPEEPVVTATESDETVETERAEAQTAEVQHDVAATEMPTDSGEYWVTARIRRLIEGLPAGTALSVSEILEETGIKAGRTQSAANQIFRRGVVPLVAEGLFTTIGKTTSRRYVVASGNTTQARVAESTHQQTTVAVGRVVTAAAVEEPKAVPAPAKPALAANRFETAKADPTETILLSPKGLGVRRNRKGNLSVMLEDRELDEFTGYGDLPAVTLLALALRVYDAGIRMPDIQLSVARLGLEVNKDQLQGVLNRLQGRIIADSRQLIKCKSDREGDIWSLNHGITPTREQCYEILTTLGFHEVKAHRFLA